MRRLILVSGAATEQRPHARRPSKYLALRVFNAADRDGVVVTRKLTDKLLADLGGHSDTCDCGLCVLVDLAAPSQGVLDGQPRGSISINYTRARATR